MKLALSSYAFNWAVGIPGYVPEQPMTVFDLLEQAIRLGVHVIQVVDNIPFELLAREEQDHFAHMATEAGIEIEVGIRGIQDNHLVEGIDLATRMGAKILRAVVEKGDFRPSQDEIVRVIEATVPLLQKSGVSLALENTERFKAKTYSHIIKCIDSDCVGICLDTTNSFGIGEGIETVLETLGPFAIDLHLKDYCIYRLSNLLGFVLEGRPAGQGLLDIPWILEEMRRFDRNPNVILELWTPQETTLEKTKIKEQEWVNQSIQYLRRLIPN